MNSRERVIAACERRRPDRPPIDLTCTPEAMAALQKHLGQPTGAAVLDHLDVDMRRVGLPFIGPAERSAIPLGSEGIDFWGCRIRKVVTESNTYYEWDGHPLAHCKTVADVDAHDWPSLDWWDYSAMPRLIEEQNAAGRRAIMFFAGCAFETPWYLRRSGAVPHRSAPATGDRRGHLPSRRGVLPAARAACAGSRRRPDRPHRHWRGHRHPARHDAQPRALAAAHQALFGTPDPHLQVARLQDLLPLVRLDRAGHPRSDRGRAGPAGSDPAPGGRHEHGGLFAAFGDRLSFHGGIDEQELLPLGTAEQVYAETTRVIEILGQNGGYVVAAAHNVQAAGAGAPLRLDSPCPAHQGQARRRLRGRRPAERCSWSASIWSITSMAGSPGWPERCTWWSWPACFLAVACYTVPWR